MALLRKERRSKNAKAIKQVILLSLPGNIFREKVIQLNEIELKQRLSFLTLIPFFNLLQPEQQNSIASSMYKRIYDKDEVIIVEGNTGDSLLIISEGEVVCYKGDRIIRKLIPKDFFGEYAILFDLKRSLSIKANIPTTCYQICKELLIKYLGDGYKNIIIKAIVKQAFLNSKYLKVFSEEFFLDRFLKCYKLNTYNDGDVVVKADDINNPSKLVVIIVGNLVFGKGKKIVTKRNELFGDTPLKNLTIISDDDKQCDIIAEDETRTIEFEWSDDTMKCLNLDIGPEINELSKATKFFYNLLHLKKIQIFRNTSDTRLIEICKMMNKEKFDSGQVIFNDGDEGDKLYLIKKGKIEVFKDNRLIREIGEGNCFGELAILVNTPRTATIKAKTKVTLYSLTKENFKSIVDKNLLSYLIQKMSLQDSFVTTLNDLYYCKCLGKGKFGNVSLVHNGKYFYAIKAVSLKVTEKRKNLIKHFIQEKNVLQTLDHPFIMKLVRTFKNKENIFYLTEFINGKVLDKLIEKKRNSFRNYYETQFYISFLFIILDYLNAQKICHRDLKPDNLMIDEKGYLKLIDFGTSIQLTNNFSNTITGTPHYIAPEVLLGKGYSFSCDYWSVGIITYELYYGVYPFGQNASEPMEVYKEVMKKDLTFPDNGNEVVNDFIKSLLHKKVYHRLCSLKKAKESKFFDNFPWDDLVDFKLKPPHKVKGVELEEISNYTLKYVDYLQKEKNKKKVLKLSPIESEISDEADTDDVNVPPNWSDQF